MAQYEMNLRDYWLIVRRRRMIIIVCTVLVAGSSFWFARQKVPQYTATAAVKFEQSTTLSGLLVEVLAVNGSDNIETQVSRSEEHTSELQSHSDLVCRLLLEKKEQ